MSCLTNDFVTFYPSLSLTLCRTIPRFPTFSTSWKLLVSFCFYSTLGANGCFIPLKAASSTLAPEIERLVKPGPAQHARKCSVYICDKNLQHIVIIIIMTIILPRHYPLMGANYKCFCYYHFFFNMWLRLCFISWVNFMFFKHHFQQHL